MWCGLLATLLSSCASSDPAGDVPGAGTSLYALVETIEGTSFYPPLGPEPTPAGTFDPTLLARLAVVLETEDGAGRVATLATFSSSTRPGLVLLAEHELYWMNVPAAAYFTDPSLGYRFRALLDGREIGRSDMSSKVFEVLRYVPALPIGVKLRIEARPAPVLSSLSPSSAVAGSAGFTLTVTGAHLAREGTVVRFAGQDHGTRSGGDGVLLADIPSSAISAPGSYPVTLFTPSPGGGESAPRSFTVRWIERAPRTIGAGEDHACMVHEDGSVWCAGKNFSGQLGRGLYDRPYAAPVEALAGAVQVVGGDATSCALLGDGTVWCWGNTDVGIPDAGPIQVPGLDGVVELAAEEWQSCARRGDGTVWCWDMSWFGVPDAPWTVAPVAGIAGAVQVSQGRGFACALLADGTVSCWGVNESGQLGTGDLVDAEAPTSVRGLAGVVAIQAGAWHTCAILEDATVWCWGDNSSGQLGDGTTQRRTRPVRVSGLADAVSVALGWSSTCALVADGSVSCWGRNDLGQLGLGSSTYARLVPTTVPGVAGVVRLASGSSFVLAQRSDGSLFAWGNNDTGALCDRTFEPRRTPVPSYLGADDLEPVVDDVTAAITCDAPDTIITLQGSLFAPGATAAVAGTPLATTFVSSEVLTALVPAGLLATAGWYPVTASNSPLSLGVATGATLFVNVPTALVTSLVPSHATRGGPTFTLTLIGQKFLPGVTVQLYSTTLPSTRVSATELRVEIASSLIRFAGTLPLRVQNHSGDVISERGVPLPVY